MQNTGIQMASTNGTALNAEHYQTFEMAKEYDSIIGGDNISQIRSYAAYARAQAQAIHKTIAAIRNYDDVAAIKAEATETAQTFAKVGLYADQRIGEILRELPTGHGNRFSDTQETLKADAIKESGISKSQVYDLQKMAANPEIVEAVIAKAEAEGRLVSRKQVLDAIRQRDNAEKELEKVRDELADAYHASELMEVEAANLRHQLSKLPEPQVVERVVVNEVVKEVVPEDYDELVRQVKALEEDKRFYSGEAQQFREKLNATRKELDKAKGILGMSENMQDVRRDVQYLTSATNQYVRRFGGLTWTVQQLDEVDEPTLDDFKKAVRNLATFSSTLMSSLEEMANGQE